MRKVAVVLWLIIILSGIVGLFWHFDYVYSLPTPIPATYKPVNIGTAVHLPIKEAATGKPLFVHFFNPDCPCSRFNISHFKSLVKQYGNQVTFAIVVTTSEKEYTASDIRKKFELQLPVYFDSTIAAKCGVYSTPQAAIITAKNILYYRGNYNKSRYCTNAQTNYAQQALTALLNQNQQPVFNRFALTAYGCQLPKCTIQDNGR